MPSSRPNIIPIVIHLVRQLKLRSILDVGIGFGKWGHLFREYTDILEAEHDPARYEKNNWQVRIDGLEGHAPYVTAMHRYLYDEIHVGDAAALMKTLPSYDLIFLGDVIEHFEKEAGLQLLRDGLARANKAVIVSTPRYDTEQEDLCGNELERHRSLWTSSDFRRFPGAQVKTVDGAILLAVLPRPGLPRLTLTACRRQGGADMAKLQRARQEIRRLIPRGARFILIDEEHLRGALPEQQTVPFLEKQGQYWGPPADDATAISELERLHEAGAQFAVFVWTTFWWLEHYAGFQRYLRSSYACLKEDEQVVAFDLRRKADQPAGG